MKFRKKKLVAPLAFVALLAIVTSGFYYYGLANSIVRLPAVQTGDTSAKITITEGDGTEVLLAGSENWQKAISEASVESGTKVKTDANSKAEINYPSGTVTRLDTNSEITLKEFAPDPQNIVVAITKGRIWSSVAKLLGRESYTTESQTAVATVRGTAYVHEVLDDGTAQVIVTEHTVEVGCSDTSKNIGKKGIEEGLMAKSDCKTEVKPVNIPTKVLEDNWIKDNIIRDEEVKEERAKDLEAKESKGEKIESTVLLHLKKVREEEKIKEDNKTPEDSKKELEKPTLFQTLIEKIKDSKVSKEEDKRDTKAVDKVLENTKLKEDKPAVLDTPKVKEQVRGVKDEKLPEVTDSKPKDNGVIPEIKKEIINLPPVEEPKVKEKEPKIDITPKKTYSILGG